MKKITVTVLGKREGVKTKMTEEQYKALCKWMVDNGNRPLSKNEKELFKLAIDKANSPEQIVLSI